MSKVSERTVTAYDRMMRSRVFMGIGQEEMAAMLGYSRRTVSNWERGVSEPPMSALGKWAQITGRSIDWIVWGDQPRPEMIPASAAASENKNSPAETDGGDTVRPKGFEPLAF